MTRLSALQTNAPDPRTLLIFLALVSLSAIKLFGQCSTDINFNEWSEVGPVDSGDWDVASDGEGVVQSVNGNPTFFLSPNKFMNVRITGSIQVDATTTDDDFVGFVFSALSPTSPSSGTVTNLDLWLLDWKGASQSSADEGFSLVRINDTFNFSVDEEFTPFFWTHGSNDGFDIKEEVYNDNLGWVPGQVHNFELVLRPNRVTITMDNVQIIDRQDCFEIGQFGFYNFSQENVTYSDFSYEIFTEFTVPDELCTETSFTPDVFSSACFDTDENDLAGTISSWFWQFGNDDYSFQMKPNYVYEESGSYEIRLTITDLLGCSAEFSTIIQVEKRPSIFIDSYEGCEGDLIELSASNETPDIPITGYTWDFDGDGFNDASGSAVNYLFDFPGTYEFQVVGISSGCNDTALFNVPIYAIPEIDFNVNTLSGRSVQLTNLTENATSFSWDFGDGGFSVQENPNYTYTEDGEYEIILTVLNNGCENELTKSITIQYEDFTFIPTAFSPNGDGSNDQFRILDSDLVKSEMCVFNHWGQLIFQGNDLENGWDGTSEGENTQAGNYTYIISGENAQGEKRNFNGLITLVR